MTGDCHVQFGERLAGKFRWPTHLDFMGIVYHANYLCYLERARTELLRKNNWMLSDLIKQDILFAIKEYLIPLS